MRIASLTIVAAMISLGSTAAAQRPYPIGVTAHDAQNPPATKHAQSSIAVRSDEEWDQQSFWKWTGIGILSGAAVGVTWAAIEISHSKDPMLANAGLAIGAGGGAIIGGLAGAFMYIISRSPGPPSMDSGR
jgi:hypothetical protein